MTETSFSCRCPPDSHNCPHRSASLEHDHRRNRKSADILLAFLTIFCSPAVVWIKTGKRDLTLNIILFCIVFLPGWIHAWYILLQHPGCHRCDLTGHHTVSYHPQTYNHSIPAATPSAIAQTYHAPPHNYQPTQQQQYQRAQNAPTLELPSRSSVQEAPTRITPPSSMEHVAAGPISAMNTGDSRGGHWDGVQSPVSAVSSQGTKVGAMPPEVLLRDGYAGIEEEKRDPDLPRYAA